MHHLISAAAALPPVTLAPSRFHAWRRRVHPFLMPVLSAIFIVTGFLWIVGPALAQALNTPVSSSTVVDMMPLIQLVIMAVWLIVGVVGAWFIYHHVKDENTRNALLNIFEKGLSWGFNTTQGATKDRKLDISVGSSVVASGLRYVIKQGPDALARFGFDDKAAARALWARLPDVDGEVTDATFDNIVAAARGQAAPNPSGPIDYQALVNGLLDELRRRKAPDASPTAVHPDKDAPAAPAVAPPTSAVPPATTGS